MASRPRALLFLAAAAACGRADTFERALDTAGPFTTSAFAVYLNRTTERLIRIDPEADQPLAWLDLRAEPGEIAIAPGDRALVLARDRAVLLAVDVAALTAAEIALPAVFDRIVVTPEGRHAVLSHAAAGSRDRAASNVNEIAVIDLESGAPKITRILLETESLGPRGFAFGPAAGAPPRLALALLDRGIALFELENPAAGSLRVNLTPASAAAQPPVQVAFSADGTRIFARADGTDDVYAVTLASEGGALSASVNFLTGGRGPADLVTLSDPAFRDQVLVVYRTEPAVALLDARGLAAEELLVPLPRVAARASVVRTEGREVVLLYDTRGGTDALFAFDPVSRRLKSARLDASPDFVAVDAERAVAIFGSRRGTLGTVTAAAVMPGAELRLRLQPIALRTPLRAAALTATGQAVLLPEDGRALVSLDLATLALAEVALDERAPVLAAAGAGWIADHRAASGRATLVRRTFDRAGARELWGFLLAGEFDPPEER